MVDPILSLCSLSLLFSRHLPLSLSIILDSQFVLGNINAGHAFGTDPMITPGYFRMCFAAAKSLKALESTLKRLNQYLESKSNV